ncbi:MAG: LysM peptidoglycan-binding domain-containing protein [Devosia sp.]|uniref:LysM peptidoglycan-binding domain-containing protein n=1 Tax=Devosia sp. TaxID=1871048 RepID=UPI0024C700F9|nr:LysM peptidoglycan-binding domain-containing protein [Devosia sp.]UYN99759.1 MAG: LysM peptidoglycan-binding domain-containing protein [Devosia sp.]
MVSCFNSADGMGQCLRGKMVEVGLVPAPPPAAVADVPVDGEAVPAEPAEDVALVDPALDVTAPDATETAIPDDLIAATFGLLRAEPDGSVVIAGSGTPGSSVDIFANGALLGSTVVEQSGDWVFVPDTPLEAGGVEVTLGETGKPGAAEKSFVVVIDEDRTSQPLVVASTPGAASEVLQGLSQPMEVAQADTPAPAAETAPAAVAPEAATETPAAPVDAEAGQPATAPDAMAAPETADASEPATEAAEPAEAVATEPEAAVAADGTTTSGEPAQATSEPAAAAPAEAAPASTDAAPVDQDVAQAAPDAEPATPAESVAETPAAETATEAPSDPAVETPAAEATSPDVDVAAVEQPAQVTPEPTTALADIQPSIDAIEIEGQRTFFAGGGPEGGIMRLYVDDSFVADTVVEDGRWLVEGGDVLTKPSQRIRVDLLQPGTSTVVSRAEVDFVVDLPEAPAETVVAQADTPEVSEPASTNVETAAVQPSAVPADVAPAVDAPAASEPATTPAEPEAAEPAAIEAPAVTAPTDPVQPSATETPAVTPSADPQPAADATAEAAAPEAAPAASPAESEPTVEAAPQPEIESTPAEPAVPTLVAVSVGDPEAQRFASGKAIIRRGDNLWTIARRVYGEGIKYTTIYQANTGQIRDPDRIYPGQVFELPEGLVQ